VLAKEGVDDALRRAFVVYLLSMAKVLAPRLPTR